MAMSENSVKILEYVKEHNNENMAYTDIAAGIGIGDRSALGSINALVKKDYLSRTPAEIEIEAMGKDGEPKTVIKTINFIHVTEKGAAFDPTVDAE